jgi:hypothetical protein
MIQAESSRFSNHSSTNFKNGEKVGSEIPGRQIHPPDFLSITKKSPKPASIHPRKAHIPSINYKIPRSYLRPTTILARPHQLSHQQLPKKEKYI